MLVPYDRIALINLEKRADRRVQMRRELARIGLGDDPRVRFFPAIEPFDRGRWKNIGEHGCFMSHYAVVQEAARSGESLLLLEDDCDFTDAAMSSDWGRGSDIFYGGYWVPDFSDPHGGIVQGAHCMGFSSRTLQPLAKFFEQLLEESRPPPADGVYVDFRRQYPDLVTSFARPQIAVQRQSASDISPGRYDRNSLFAPFLRLARAVNRGRYRRDKMLEGMAERLENGS
jgi:glycosyl transferase family 25